jgi:hypothetical protein
MCIPEAAAQRARGVTRLPQSCLAQAGADFGFGRRP